MKIHTLFTFIFITMFTASSSASNIIITKSFTGGWYDPDKSGQGFLIEIIKSNDQKKALSTWFTFDTNGNQYWLTGVGEIENQSIHFEMVLAEGGKFGNLHNSAEVTRTLWGSVDFTFTDCNHGTVSWSPVIGGFSSGSMPVVRNTVINNLNCTGGLFDELADTLKEADVITPLQSTGLDADASGKTKYEQRTDRIDYAVEIEDLPVGTYQLFVGDVMQANIQVKTTAGGRTEGEVEFRDPVEPGKLRLDFNPQNQVIDIVQNNLVYLTTEHSSGGGLNTGGNSSPDAPPFGDSETQVYFTNTAIYPAAQAKAKLKQRADRVDFQVELEDVPLGFYDFNINGDIQGVIQITQTPTGPEGELEFRNPVEAGKQLLNFNPLGAVLTITQGADILFTVNFPVTPAANTGNDDCDPGPSNEDCSDDGGNNGSGTGTQNIEIEVDFTNTGMDADASGSVDYEVRSDRIDFKVEVEDLEQGNYQLVVGGQTITTFTVTSNATELEFRDPVEPGKLDLNFEPLYQLIEIKNNGSVYLSALLQ